MLTTRNQLVFQSTLFLYNQLNCSNLKINLEKILTKNVYQNVYSEINFNINNNSKVQNLKGKEKRIKPEIRIMIRMKGKFLN